MAESNFRGPVNSMGSLEADSSSVSTATITPLDGPSMFYQGVGIADPRGFPFAKDGTAPARQSAFYGACSPLMVDALPMTFSSFAIASSQSFTTGAVPLTVSLITSAPTNPVPGAQFYAMNVPILPQGTSIVTTAAIALDFGFTTGTTTANSTVVQVPDSTQFTLGQWVYVGNANSATGNTGYFGQVMAISTSNFTTISLSAAAGTGMCAPIGQAALFGSQLLPIATQFGPGNPVPTYVMPNTNAGFMRVHNPQEALARGVYLTVTPLASTSGTYTFTVFGWDVWRMPMSEQITKTLATTNATTVWGKKAFKYIGSVVASASQTTATVSVGISDIFGFPLRVDNANYLSVTVGGTTIVNGVGITGAISTTGSPATNTTGDVRGTVQLSGVGGGTPISAIATTGGTTRLTIFYDIPPWNVINATPLNPVPLFGNTQSTT